MRFSPAADNLVLSDGEGGNGLDFISANDPRAKTFYLDRGHDGTPDARLDLLFRERAFWLLLTGHRLGDLRRLVRVYGRSAESVFPTGTNVVGDSYGKATSLLFMPTGEEEVGTGVTGCTK